MAKRDYYEVLGVPKTASEAEIKSAYRKKAKECHPDLHQHDKTAEERFKELNEANEVLCDADKRARYDQFGFDGPVAQGFGGGGEGFEGFGGFGGFGDFSSIFDSILGGNMGGNRILARPFLSHFRTVQGRMVIRRFLHIVCHDIDIIHIRFDSL